MSGRMRCLGLCIVLAVMLGCGRRGEPAASPGEIAGLVTSSGKATKKAFGREVRQLLGAGQYDSLEALAVNLETSRARLPDGTWKLRHFYAEGMGEVDDEGNALQWNRQIRQLRGWVAQRPQSGIARIALAYALHAYAWEARGTGSSITLTDSAVQLMSARLAEAESVLVAGRPLPGGSSLGWWQSALQIGHLAGLDRETYDRVYGEAMAREPLYEAYSCYRAAHLLPRWYGAPGEMEAFADSLATALPPPEGDILYARMAWYLTDLIGSDALFGQTHLSWPRIQAGYAALRRNYPESVELPSQLGLLAWARHDSTVARAVFHDLGNRVDVSVWGSREGFVNARREMGLGPTAAP